MAKFVRLFSICIIINILCLSCNGQSKVENRTRKIDLSICKSKKLKKTNYLEHKVFDKVGDIDTVKISDGIISILKSKIYLKAKSDYESDMIFSDIQIYHNENLIFKRDSILSVGPFEYNKVNNLLTIPLITSQNQDDFQTNSDLVLIDFKNETSKYLKKSLINSVNAFFSVNGKSIFYLDNNSLYKLDYIKNSETKILEFEENNFFLLDMYIIEKSKINVIYIKDIAIGDIFETEINSIDTF